jgi:hypothetical protein
LNDGKVSITWRGTRSRIWKSPVESAGRLQRRGAVAARLHFDLAQQLRVHRDTP